MVSFQDLLTSCSTHSNFGLEPLNLPRASKESEEIPLSTMFWGMQIEVFPSDTKGDGKSQMLSIRRDNLIIGIPCIISGFYASALRCNRKTLCDQISQVTASSQFPLCFLGDFNCVLAAHEKLSLRTPPSSFKEFNVCLLAGVGF